MSRLEEEQLKLVRMKLETEHKKQLLLDKLTQLAEERIRAVVEGK